MALTEEKEKHESYGMVSFSRCSGQPKLFKSDIQGGNFISLKINTASVEHSLSRDWTYAEEHLIEVYLSPAQFAELLTTMNYGSGVPCTIRYFNGKVMEPVPERDSEEKIISDNFEKEMREFSKTLEEEVTEAKKILTSGKAPNKAEREQILKYFQNVVSKFNNSMPFILESFQESVQKTVVQAKAEIESQVTAVVQKTGLDSLKNMKTNLIEGE